MREIAHLQRMNIGSRLRAFTLGLGKMAAPIAPFLGMSHAGISAPTFQPHSHAGFSAVSYRLHGSETGVYSRESG